MQRAVIAIVTLTGIACSSVSPDDDPRRPSRAGGDEASSTSEPSAQGDADDPAMVPTPPAVPFFFGAAYVEDHATLDIPSDGDLWPSCWSNDDALYTANGDGAAFGGPFVDIAVSKVTGSPFATPPNLAGSTIARADALGQIWTPGGRYNRKPTGMLCIDGAIYMAVQDLELDFMDAPAATIAVSRDNGITWSWDKTKPMFSGHVMTTLMFLDFGKDAANAIDDFVYVYALDRNWRFSTRVKSPTELWLARVPKAKVQDRSAWEYFAGIDANGLPRFESDLASRVPVLEDKGTVYQKPYAQTFARDMTVLSQGSVVYDAPLDRYIYTSWTEFTFEFYEAPKPWGPWKKFLSRDYGVYPWSPALNGGYATTIPSKFISADGKTMFVQSNTFVGGVKNYQLSFRKVTVDPFVPGAAANARSSANLAHRSGGGVPYSRAGHANSTTILNDGDTGMSIDSWTGEEKSEDYWGVVWARSQNVNRIAYTTGEMFPDGGWFTSIRPQVRREDKWVDVTGVTASPAYPGSAAAGDNVTYVFSFDAVMADGVRVVGVPGGSRTFTSAAEIAASFE